jgi:hypothetical protein
MRMQRLMLIAAATSLSFCCTARAELTVAVYTGTSRTDSSDLRVEQPGSRSNAEFHGVRWRARPFGAAPYYGVRISYFPARSARLGGNVDFTHYKMYAETDRLTAVQGTWNGAHVDELALMSRRVQSFELSHGVNLTSLNVDYRWLADSSSSFAQRWQPHIGAGVVCYLPHAEGSINGRPSGANYQFAGAGYQLFAGTEYRVFRRLSVFVESKFDNGKLDIHLAPTARVQTDVRTVHALAGVAWHF